MLPLQAHGATRASSPSPSSPQQMRQQDAMGSSGAAGAGEGAAEAAGEGERAAVARSARPLALRPCMRRRGLGRPGELLESLGGLAPARCLGAKLITARARVASVGEAKQGQGRAAREGRAHSVLLAGNAECCSSLSACKLATDTTDQRPGPLHPLQGSAPHNRRPPVCARPRTAPRLLITGRPNSVSHTHGGTTTVWAVQGGVGG